MATRKQRGHDTQRAVAGYLALNGWPFAQSTGAGRPGEDITGVPGLSIEVKARRELAPLAWLRQAAGRAGLPLVVFRPDGAGEASVAAWGVLLRLDDAAKLLRLAGYASTDDAS